MFPPCSAGGCSDRASDAHKCETRAQRKNSSLNQPRLCLTSETRAFGPEKTWSNGFRITTASSRRPRPPGDRGPARASKRTAGRPPPVGFSLELPSPRSSLGKVPGSCDSTALGVVWVGGLNGFAGPRRLFRQSLGGPAPGLGPARPVIMLAKRFRFSQHLRAMFSPHSRASPVTRGRRWRWPQAVRPGLETSHPVSPVGVAVRGGPMCSPVAGVPPARAVLFAGWRVEFGVSGLVVGPSTPGEAQSSESLRAGPARPGPSCGESRMCLAQGVQVRAPSRP